LKTVLTTQELLEPVERSVLLASLTNNLPTGMSLLKLKLVQEEPKQIKHATPTNKYREAQAKTAEETGIRLSPERLLETHIDIEGLAPSDLQVAAYIERLGSSTLLDNVALVESREQKIGNKPTSDTTFRQFKLTAMLKKDVHLGKEDIEKIRAKREKASYSF